MQSVLVGTDLNGCAFVCGSLSFLDKISCGLALYFLESFQSEFFFAQTLNSKFLRGTTQLNIPSHV